MGFDGGRSGHERVWVENGDEDGYYKKIVRSCHSQQKNE